MHSERPCGQPVRKCWTYCYVRAQRWLAFQLLAALAQCHERGVCHGDLKCENVLVSSWDWLFLADFATHKPTYLPADNPVRRSFHCQRMHAKDGWACMRW